MGDAQERKRARLGELLTGVTAVKSRYTRRWADQLIATGEVDVTLPPEPQWTPGQVVVLTLGKSRQVAERNAQNTGWFVIASSTTFADDEVTDVAPATVLTTEEQREAKAEVWDDAFVAGAMWQPSGPSGVPHDPPPNPHRAGGVSIDER